MKIGDYVFTPLYSRLKLKPDVFIAGFQKCGTTSLYRYLTALEEFIPGRKKEWNILSDKTYSYADYLSNFPFRFQAKGRRTLCASHQISYAPIGVERLQKHFPKAKVIFIMRNPVDRAFSRYRHNQSKPNPRHDIAYPFTFEELCNLEMELVRNMADVYDAEELHFKTAYFNPYGLPLTRGIYYPFIKLFANSGFPCFYCSLENLILNFNKEFQDILNFLNVNCRGPFPEPIAYNSTGDKSAINAGFRKKLLEFYRPHNEKLFKFIGQTYDWSR